MPTFTGQANSVVVPRLIQRVRLGGELRSDCFCTGVSYSAGTGGSVASFTLPALGWDESKDSLRGVPVTVEAGFETGSLEAVFSGFVRSTSGTARGDSLSFSAGSLLTFADGVYLGQGLLPNGDMVASYPVRAYRASVLEETGWRITSVLRDWFSSSSTTWRGGGGRLPSQWRAMLELGSMDALGQAFEDIPLGDLVFRQSTLRDALDHILGMAGTVSLREVFQPGGGTRLDFFLLADPGAPIRDVKVARRDGSALGTNVLDITHEESAEDVRTRLIALGDRKRYVITITTAHATAPLRKGWDTALEATVLNNPDAAKRGDESGQAGDDSRAEFSEAAALVFRRYLLPAWVRDFIIDKENGVELSDGSKLAIQVFKFPRILAHSAGAWTSTASEVPKLLEGTELNLDRGEFTLKAPAINMVSAAVVSGDIVDSYEAAEVGITLTIAAERLMHDTGRRSGILDLEGIGAAGLADVVVNESFAFRQLGGTIAGHAHTAWVLVGGEWTLYETPETMQDDTAPLRQFGEGALREKARIRATYNVTTPFFSSAYRLGDRVRLVGQDDFDFGLHQVLSLSHDLTNGHATTFGTDSSVPLTNNEILRSGGGA